MTFEKGDLVEVRKKVVRSEYELLKKNNIKPGTIGVIQDTYSAIKFGDIIITLKTDSIDYNYQRNKKITPTEDATLDQLKNMFGFK